MSKRRRGVRLEMTSLMDVMFLVMVFFIYCIFDMAVHKGVKVELPEGVGAQEKGERIVITIRADNSMQLNGKDAVRNEVVAKIRGMMAEGKKKPVLISADAKAGLGVGIGLLSELKSVGVEKTSFQVSGEKP